MTTKTESAIAEAIGFFNHYSLISESEQDDLITEKNNVLGRLKIALKDAEGAANIREEAWNVIDNYDRLVSSGKIEDRLYLDAHIENLRNGLV